VISKMKQYCRSGHWLYPLNDSVDYRMSVLIQAIHDFCLGLDIILARRLLELVLSQDHILDDVIFRKRHYQ
jgi:hypothetical protein